MIIKNFLAKNLNNLKTVIISLIYSGACLAFSGLALSDEIQNQNCTETGCSQCQQMYPEEGKTEFNFKNGKYDGPQKIYYKNGHLWKESTFKDGQIDGVEKIYYKDGQLWDTLLFKDGVLLDSKNKPWNGAYKRFYKNGQLAVDAQLKDGYFQGELKNYFENGKIESIYNYSNKKLSFVKFGSSGISLDSRRRTDLI